MIFARKRFGQHFLHDRSVLDRIVREIAPQPDQALLEIGPGRGALTERLIGQSRTLDAIEIDRDLAAQLRARWGAPQAFELHEADALEFDLAALARMRGAPPARHRQPALQHFDAAAVSRRRRPRAHRRPARDAAEGSHRPHRRRARQRFVRPAHRDARALVRGTAPVRRRPGRLHARRRASGRPWRA